MRITSLERRILERPRGVSTSKSNDNLRRRHSILIAAIPCVVVRIRRKEILAVHEKIRQTDTVTRNIRKHNFHILSLFYIPDKIIKYCTIVLNENAFR